MIRSSCQPSSYDLARFWCEVGGELVLRLAGDAPLESRDGLAVTHRQPGARLGVARLIGREVGRANLEQRGDASLGVLGAVGLEQDLAELVAHGERGVRRGVGATGDAGLDLAERDLVGDQHGGLDAGVAGLLHVECRSVGRELGAENRLASEVEVAAVLEHGTGSELADPLTVESVARDEAVNGRGEHFLVGGTGVDGVGARERNAVAADHGDASYGLLRRRARQLGAVFGAVFLADVFLAGVSAMTVSSGLLGVRDRNSAACLNVTSAAYPDGGLALTLDVTVSNSIPDTNGIREIGHTQP